MLLSLDSYADEALGGISDVPWRHCLSLGVSALTESAGL